MGHKFRNIIVDNTLGDTAYNITDEGEIYLDVHTSRLLIYPCISRTPYFGGQKQSFPNFRVKSFLGKLSLNISIFYFRYSGYMKNNKKFIIEHVSRLLQNVYTQAFCPYFLKWACKIKHTNFKPTFLMVQGRKGFERP